MTIPIPVNPIIAELIRDSPFLELGVEQELFRRIKTNRDPKAIDAVVRAYMRLVVKLAHRRYKGAALDDKISAGSLGLIRAIHKFDPDISPAFAGYATLWIRAEIKQYVYQNWAIVAPPVGNTPHNVWTVLGKYYLWRSSVASHVHNLSADREAEACELFGITPKKIVTLEALLRGSQISLDAPVFDDDPGSSSLVDHLVTEGASPEDHAITTIWNEQFGNRLQAAINDLKSRTQDMVRRYYSGDGETLKVIGTSYGITTERTRQLIMKAIRDLREDLWDLAPYLE